MHNHNLVMAIKANGKVLREFRDIVYLPFGTEYSIFLKNLSSSRVRVWVSIDGSTVLDDHSLVIDGNRSLELHRSIRDGNLTEGNSFKFIEKTAAVEKHRGNKADDGLVTIKYEFEQNISPLVGGNLTGGTYPYQPSRPRPRPDFSDAISKKAWGWKPGETDSPLPINTVYSMAINSAPIAGSNSNVLRSANPINTAGVTAPGSISTQQFSVARYFFGKGEIHTMTIKLEGEVPTRNHFQVEVNDSLTSTQITETVTKVTHEISVKKHIHCTMCGTKVHQLAKFCHECGASVLIV